MLADVYIIQFYECTMRYFYFIMKCNSLLILTSSIMYTFPFTHKVCFIFLVYTELARKNLKFDTFSTYLVLLKILIPPKEYELKCLNTVCTYNHCRG